MGDRFPNVPAVQHGGLRLHPVGSVRRPPASTSDACRRPAACTFLRSPTIQTHLCVQGRQGKTPARVSSALSSGQLNKLNPPPRLVFRQAAHHCRKVPR